MIRRLLAFLLVALLPSPLFAQQYVVIEGADTTTGQVVDIADAVSKAFRVLLTGTASDNTANSGTKLPTLPCVATSSAPSWTNTNMAPCSVDLAGNLRITGLFAVESGGHLAALDTNQGATADAAVTGDVSGSVAAKLRGLSKILNDVWDTGNHQLKVTTGSGGTSQTDRAAFTYGTTPFTPIGGVYNGTITALTSGQAGAAAITPKRALFTTMVDSGDTDMTNTSEHALNAHITNGGFTFNNATSSNNAEAGIGQDAAITVSGTLQSGVTANGNGTALTVLGESSAVLTVNCSSCSGGTTVFFEVSEDASNFVAANARQLGTSFKASSTTTSGITAWVMGVANLQKVRARVGSYSAGTITVTAHASPVALDAIEASETPVLANALSTTVLTVVSTPKVLSSYYCLNPNAATAYVQVFDTSGTVTLGTTVPKRSIGIPAGAAANLAGLNEMYLNAIKAAATTTATGSTANNTALDCNFGYK